MTSFGVCTTCKAIVECSQMHSRAFQVFGLRLLGYVCAACSPKKKKRGKR
jgi:hypothetical protein